MTDILQKISEYKRLEIEAAKKACPPEDMTAKALRAGKVRGFEAALRMKRRQGKTGLIAEIKKASPSKGLIRPSFDPASFAAAYERGGAACLSVLTDGPGFQGAPEHLAQARKACDLPVLRKDFMFTPYQVHEARALGSDCILIIMAAVTDDEARDLQAAARDWGMDVLFEIHDETELERALALAPSMLGINNRDLRDFSVSLQTTLSLCRMIDDDMLVVSESGICTPEDISLLAGAGVTTVLVGESLMRQDNIEDATKSLLAQIPC